MERIHRWIGSPTSEIRGDDMDKLWKQAERRIAGLLGARRVPVTGRHKSTLVEGETDCDLIREESPQFLVEVKNRKGMPKYLQEWLAQSKGTLPRILVWHRTESRYESSLVLLTLEDFRSLLKLSASQDT
jgi:hypothetical protein